jgi:hypothetical protein
MFLQFVRMPPERLWQTSNKLVKFFDDERKRLSLEDSFVVVLPVRPHLLSLLRRGGVQWLEHYSFQVLPTQCLLLAGLLVQKQLAKNFRQCWLDLSMESARDVSSDGR